MTKKDKNFGLVMPIITSYESWDDTLMILPEPGPLLEIKKEELPMIYAVRAGIKAVEPLLTSKYHYPLMEMEL
jgi:hypothetical protein